MRCTWNSRLMCWIKSRRIRDRYCPHADRNRAFMDVLEKNWLTGRDAKALTLGGDIITGGGRFDDIRQVIKADIYRCFDNGSCVEDALRYPRCLTHDTCKDLIKGKMIWKRVNTGQVLKEAVRRVDKIYRKVFSPASLDDTGLEVV